MLQMRVPTNFQIYLLLFIASCTGEQTHTDLRSHLLDGYDSKVPPTTSDKIIKVQIGLVLNHFVLEEIESSFYANVWLTMTWNDPRLTWNQSLPNETVYTMRFSNMEIWHPDITLINNAMPTETFHFGEVHLVVQPDGTVMWTPPARLVSPCILNMIRWPYDEHTCELKLGSWTHSGREIDLELSSNQKKDSTSDDVIVIDRELYVPNSEWKLTDATAVKADEYYSCCKYPYAVVKYSFKVQRNSPSYTATIIVPIIIISMVNMMVFLLPPMAGEKITIASINFMIVCIFLIYFEARLPPLGDHLPLLVLLYCCNIVLIGISLIVSVIVITISRNRKASSPPQCMRMFCNANFASLLGLGYIVPYVSQTHARLEEGVEMRPPRVNGRASFDKDDQLTNLVVDQQEPPFMINAEWILLAATIDRLAFIVYVVVSGITLGLCLA